MFLCPGFYPLQKLRITNSPIKFLHVLCVQLEFRSFNYCQGIGNRELLKKEASFTYYAYYSEKRYVISINFSIPIQLLNKTSICPIKLRFIPLAKQNKCNFQLNGKFSRMLLVKHAYNFFVCKNSNLTNMKT